MAQPPPASRLPPLVAGYVPLKRFSGGVCEVFRARKPGAVDARQDVAVKRLLDVFREDARTTELFRSECRLMTRMHHPNLVRGLSWGDDQGQPYLVMEWVDGPDVQQLETTALKQGLRIPLGVAVSITVQALQGLHHAHTCLGEDGRPLGLVHRDVSPENMLCAKDGTVKVTDFGLAKQTARAGMTDPRMGVSGKVAFMSPERIRGEPFDARSDQFSAALMFYVLATGFRPYELRPNESAMARMQRVADADIPPPSKVFPEMPRRVEDVLMQALQARPKARFATSQDLADALQNAAQREYVACTPSTVAEFMEELGSFKP